MSVSNSYVIRCEIKSMWFNVCVISSTWNDFQIGVLGMQEQGRLWSAVAVYLIGRIRSTGKL